MKIILFIALFYSTSGLALEWNQKAFSESVNSYKKRAQEWVKDPKTVVDDFKNKYSDSYHLAKEKVQEIKVLDFKKDLENLSIYYDFFQGKYKAYSHVNSNKQALDMLSRDISNTFNFAYNNIDKVPLIGPYKIDIINRFQNLQTQIIPYRAVIQSSINHAL